MNELTPEALAVAAKMIGLAEAETARQIAYHQKQGGGNPIAYLADFAYRTALMAYGSMDTAVTLGIILGVPFVSQKGPDASLSEGDCGPACVAMCLRYAAADGPADSWPTVNDLVRELKALNRYTTSKDLIAALKAHGVAARNHGEYDRDNGSLTMGVIEQALKNKKPVIALVNYSVLAPLNSFKGLHWVVVAGINSRQVLVLDPLQEDANAGKYWVERDAFELALTYTKKLLAQARHGVVVG